jgi:hypothetical protein
MGLFDKLKSAVNVMTGGGATVTIEYQPTTGFPGDVVRVRVTATSTGGEIKSKGAFVDLQATESVHVKEGEGGDHAHVNVSRNTFSQEFQISPAFVLAPNATLQFEGQIQLPPTAQPSFAGVYTQHTWQIRGRVEAFGNDPDSGYQAFRVGAR